MFAEPHVFSVVVVVPVVVDVVAEVAVAVAVAVDVAVTVVATALSPPGVLTSLLALPINAAKAASAPALVSAHSSARFAPPYCPVVVLHTAVAAGTVS